MNDDAPADDRDFPADDVRGLDHFHFAVASAGFFLAIGGATLSSVCIFLWGSAILAWGIAYFVVKNTADDGA